MSKIALTPNASGSGTFTIASPNSDTDRTLVLPDEAGTVLTSASDVASTKLTGTLDVDASGNVTVNSSGTTTPTYDYSTLGEGLHLRYWDQSGARHADIVATGNTPAGATQDLRFFTNSGGSPGTATERMRLESSGRVGVNMTSAYAQLDVQRTDSTTNPSIRAYNTYASFSGNDLFQTYQVGQGSSSSYYHIGCFSTGGAKRFQVRGDGDVTNSNNSYGAISDQNLKENIALSGSQWDDIKALQVKKYSYISEGLDEPNQLGVIAQDLEASGMSGLVENNQTLFWHEDEDLPEGVAAGDVKVAEHKSVKYSVLYMKAVKALQEAMNRIETLEAKVAALEATP